MEKLSQPCGEVMVGTYRHYKGGVYFVTGTAVHTETGERLVTYTGVDGRVWARPEAMFTELVNGDTPRFSYIGNINVYSEFVCSFWDIMRD